MLVLTTVPLWDRYQFNTLCIVWDMKTGERICCSPEEPEENENGEVDFDEFATVHHVHPNPQTPIPKP